jgi:hypothetical protein
MITEQEYESLRERRNKLRELWEAAPDILKAKKFKDEIIAIDKKLSEYERNKKTSR